MKPRAIFFALDCLKWEQARAISYSINYGYVDALESLGFECIVVPTFGEIYSDSKSSWIPKARDWFSNDKFDIAFVTLPHIKLTTSDWEWLSTIAPIRVGLLMESLKYDQAYLQNDKLYTDREDLALNQIKHLTHVVSGDDRDVDNLSQKVDVSMVWMPSLVCGRHVAEKVSQPEFEEAAFFGTVYYERNNFVKDPDVARYLKYPGSPEARTNLPAQFDILNQEMLESFKQKQINEISDLSNFVNKHRQVRKALDDVWMAELKKWNALVNLPSLYHGYTSRVVESMASGRPVVSSRIVDSNAYQNLFKEDEEIVLYDHKSPKELALKLKELKEDKEKANYIANMALNKVRQGYTLEVALSWLVKNFSNNLTPKL